ncbi:DUF2087 domain-containing protein [Dethiothermospora halolimnae]|uniref:DUF2087 domain-containing protein n=1 Tax=Dethiothermospora halolimnae TaxID=3114390 RepID=UPI003CCB915F
MNNRDLFWNSDIDSIKKGYIYDDDKAEYICLICGKKYEEGIIYPQGDKLYDAERTMKSHIIKEHNSVFDYLINMDKRYTGLTDVQRQMLKYFYMDLSDKEIVKKQGSGSTSTIRNHRFKLNEKEKQAKVFLAIMELLKEDKVNREDFVDIHKGATMVDDRYAITEEERRKVLKNYFNKDGKLDILPSKEKKKIIILKNIVENFNNNKKYTEKEINIILKRIYEDYVTIRRYLIQYGFMKRTKDCKYYWINS